MISANDSGNRRQPIDILPLSVSVQAPIQLFIPPTECGRPTQVGGCASSPSYDEVNSFRIELKSSNTFAVVKIERLKKKKIRREAVSAKRPLGLRGVDLLT
ncbi:hypothetical protein AVEN_33097-1 [Araneus ventricosus]|uniref:Uncharacterized protein n=1 Tax=Araneus ventricosus TaxID=182803 RepID=A0A4Y2CTL9_ARAVE|nr:hypothetical protein AVEN_33097-1 [Araneus ventricosus]